ncbi:hypothetical protein NFHSH190041_14120 [Shewanella sp. NFH-SH190041]|uniref:hypothetical protein n=1 Tax=Shewanella sp. NFH-SH190041 TaxID=2950245 RepID=UPI0021C33508|nr:hypothetical protein [Shewanella sp. NFH-SH190041]BDM63960.1 hypothetical protein NFHSH190041_14120 [Shewanella sp. NFH-SH190041]
MISRDSSYFTVPYQFSAFLSPWPNNALPSDEQLEALKSPGLKLVGEVKLLEAQCLHYLRNLDNDAKAVVDFMKLQSRKVDLVLHYLLEQQAHQGQKAQGDSFGGSGMTVITAEPLQPDTRWQTTLYVQEELLCVLCIAQVKHCVPCDDGHLSELDFIAISDADVEQLVQASLRIQQKQLRARKQQLET